MSDWYYSSGNDQRQGPLAGADLVAQFRQGRIGLDTLVWRDGQAGWQPLSDFAAELRLAGENGNVLPPPLPARPALAASNYQAQPAPKSGLSGCMIAVIVAAGLSVPMIAILAAIAIPAYQDYTLRSKVGAALQVAEPIKLGISGHQAREHACPSNSDADFTTPEGYASGNVASVTIGTFETDRCGMELVLRNTGSERLDSKKIWLEYDPSASSWQCSSEIDNRYLPAACRE